MVAALTALLVAAGGLTASAYIKQPQMRILLQAPNQVRCDRLATINAKVIDNKTGKPIWGQIVRWGLVVKQSGKDRVLSTSTKTTRQGLTQTKVSFGPKAGARKVRASVAGSTPVVTVRCFGGLPVTAAVPPAGFVDVPSGALLAPPTMPETTAAMEALPATAIRVERLGIDIPLVEGDGYDVPEGVAAHHPGTAWPGDGSNTYLYAHAREGLFLELWDVATGDLVEVDMADGTVANYRVSEIHPVVEWDALEYLDPTDTEVLTLQTCLTYADTAPRFVVIAERLPQA
jgi:LPXTG-site transpeptidase (sortase) family protein